MRELLPSLQMLLVVIIVAWDILLSARIAQVRRLPRPFVFLTALAGFLLLPALAIHLATSDAITARSVSAVEWIWPITLVLFALQALYAATRRLVNPFLGFFMSTYDVIIAVDGVLRHLAAQGRPLPGFALTFLAATSGAFAFLTQSPTIIASPAFLFVPMAAPAFPALRAWSASFRFFLALVGFLWIAMVVSQVPPAFETVASYQLHDPGTERLTERPAGDLDIGIKIFPDLAGGPPPAAIKNDLALVDTLGVAVVSITIVPEEINKAGLDSIAHTLENLRGDSTQLIVTLGYPSSLNPLPGRTFNDAKRLAAIEPSCARCVRTSSCPRRIPTAPAPRPRGRVLPSSGRTTSRVSPRPPSARGPARASESPPPRTTGATAPCMPGRPHRARPLTSWASRSGPHPPGCGHSTPREGPRIAGCASRSRRRTTGSSPPAASRPRMER